MTGFSTATQATRRLLFAWNLAGAFRLATGWLAIVTSAALSVHVSPWIGIPAGFAVFGGALLLGRVLDRVSVRWVLGRLLPPGTASDLSLREATEAVQKWQFEPRVFMGRPIEQTSFTRIRFVL